MYQVLNDLLDPSRANLKLREDPKRGFYVEGIKEETLVSAEHALSVIATGVAHRKVGPDLVVLANKQPSGIVKAARRVLLHRCMPGDEASARLAC